jgi:transcriptional regulator with XRE-family HTH domain
MSTKGLNRESADQYRAFFAGAESSADYWMGVPIAELTEDICRLMEEKQISRAELARRLGTSRAYVTKLLDGNANFTLATMVKLAMALDGALHLHIADRRAATRWYDEMPAEGEPAETKAARGGRSAAR